MSADARSMPWLKGEPVAKVATAPPPLRVGHTARGTPLWLESLGPIAPRPRVLLVAGQHGDEPEGPAALRALLEQDSEELAGLGLGLAWIAEANPDGLLRGTRTTPEGIDLNRDHATLASPEARILHRVLAAFAPDVVLDLHGYPSRRAAALARGWLLDDDVLLARATHPAVLDAEGAEASSRHLEEVVDDLSLEGVAAGEYRLFQPAGRVRLSTLGTDDLRNAVALRYGAETWLVEGRHPRDDDPPEERRRLIDAERRAVRAILRRVAERPRPSATRRAAPRPGTEIAVAANWARRSRPLPVTVRDVDSGHRHRVDLEGVLGEVAPTRRVVLPTAYAVPGARGGLTGPLLRQGFAFTSGRDYTAGGGHGAADDDLVFPVDQPGGAALAVWLERASARADGAHRLDGPGP